MRLYHSPTTPFGRKVMVALMETGQAGDVEVVTVAGTPMDVGTMPVAQNPLGKIPALELDEGPALYDSRVICEYLIDLGKGASLLPASGAARWRVLTEQAMGDGMLDAALLARYEGAMRPEPLRWADWTRGQMEKIHSGLAVVNASAAGWGDAFDLGKITVACTLGYLDFRFASFDWRSQYPAAAAWFAKINARPSLQATLPPPA